MGYVLRTQYPDKTKFTMAKIALLLPNLQITAQEWEVIEKLLDGHTKTVRGQKRSKEVFFTDGYAVINTYSHIGGRFYEDTGWEYPESEETISIRDLGISTESIRFYADCIMNPKASYIPCEGYSLKDHVSDSILELTSLFTQSALKY